MRLISLLLISVFFFSYHNGKGQSVKIDSLKKLLYSITSNNSYKADTQRVFVFAKLSSEYLGQNLDTAIIYAKQGLSLAQKRSFKKGEASNLSRLAYCYIQTTEFDKARQSFLSAIKICKTMADTACICAQYSGIGKTYSRQSEFDKALTYFSYALSLSKKAKIDAVTGDVLMNIGIVYKNKGNLDTALKLYEQVYALRAQKNEKEEMANCLYNMAMVYYYKVNDKKCLEHIEKALQLFKEIEDHSSIADCYAMLAGVLDDQKQRVKALEYHKKALAVAQKINDKKLEASFRAQLGEAYSEMDSTEIALNYFNSALKMMAKLDALALKQQIELSIGQIYVNTRQYELAKKYLSEIIKNEHLADQNTTRSANTLIGKLYFKQEKPDYILAEKYLFKALKSAMEASMSSDQSNIYSYLAELNEKRGNKAEAYKYLKKHMLLKDSLFGAENTEKISELELKYETAEKDNSIKVLNDEKKIAATETQNQQQQRNTLLGGLGLSVLLMGAGTVAYRNSRKYNTYLAQEEKRKELLLQEVHHRTNNSLQLMSALLAMQSDEVDDPKAKSYLQQSESRIHSMSTLHALLNENTAQLSVNIGDYLGSVLDFHQNLGAQKVSVTSNLSNQLFPARLALPLALITNELVTNSLKYAFTAQKEPAHIHVTIGQTAITGQWSLSVHDNGVGLPEGTFLGTNGNIGSTLITILTNQLDGTLTTAYKNGAWVELNFPFLAA